jgi:hypothetical protein
MSNDEEFSRQRPASEASADEVCVAPPVSSPARAKPSTRDMILERRSRFIAAALAGAGLASAACGGRVAETSDTAGTAGTGTAGGGAAGGGTIVGPGVCLSVERDYANGIPVSAGAGGTDPVFLTAGAPQVCLSLAGAGGTLPAYLTAGAGGAPQVCLTGGAAPFVPADSPDAGEIEPEDPDGGL